MSLMPDWPVHASRTWKLPIQRQLGAVDAECRQEVEAAHPAPAWGRWTRNASMQLKPPIQRQLGAVEADGLVAVMSLMPDWPVEPGTV